MPRTNAPLRLEFILCPHCQSQHIDKGEWAEKNHSRHLCGHCKRFFFTKPGNVGVEWPHATGCQCGAPPCINCGTCLAGPTYNGDCAAACNEECYETAWLKQSPNWPGHAKPAQSVQVKE